MNPRLEERVYCSDAARLRGDDNIATAPRTDSWILVELPSTWNRNPLKDAPALPDATRKALVRAAESLPRCRVLFIRHRIERAERCRVYVVRSTPGTSGVSVVDLASIDDVATLDFAALFASATPPARPLVLVCTHGQHDSCCGRRGYPLYDVLREREDIDVWQCSHIGGDRFAANAVVLPAGIYYGPVEVRDANVLAEAAIRDEVFLPAYRGRCAVSRSVQAAETFVRRARNLTRRDALTFLDCEPAGDERTLVRLREANGLVHRVTVESYVATHGAYATCSIKASGPIRTFRLVGYETD